MASIRKNLVSHQHWVSSEIFLLTFFYASVNSFSLWIDNSQKIQITPFSYWLIVYRSYTHNTVLLCIGHNSAVVFTYGNSGRSTKVWFSGESLRERQFLSSSTDASCLLICFSLMRKWWVPAGIFLPWGTCFESFQIQNNSFKNCYLHFELKSCVFQ